MIRLCMFYSTIIVIFDSVFSNPDLTLVFESRDNSSYNANCVIGGNAWHTVIFWENNGVPLVSLSSSRYIPKYSQITFEEETDDWVTNNWIIGQSSTKLFRPVTDERWEMFQTDNLILEKTLWKGKQFVSVSFSVFISNFDYRILIGDKYYVDITSKLCSLGEIRKGSVSSRKLHGNKLLWFHLDISRINDIMKVTFSPKQDQIEWNVTKTDNFEEIKITNGLKSKNASTSGFWKLHKYQYLYSEVSYERTHQIGQPIIHNGKLCMTMFTAVCNTCYLNITLKVDGERLKTLRITAAENQTEHYLWKRIVIKEKKYVKNNITLFAQKVNSQMSNGFWAIDDIRLCNLEEVRVASVSASEKDNITCRSLANKKFSVSQSEVSLTNLSCEAGKLGQSCNISCKSIFQDQDDYCGNIICQSEGCSCSWGFQGEKCNEKCSHDSWGENCSRICGNCNSVCKPFNGVCSDGCQQTDIEYTDTRCSRSLPVFKNNPTVVNRSHTEIKIGIKSVDYVGSDIPKTILIQYREENEKLWKNSSSVTYLNNIQINPYQTYDITGLTPATVYDIRAVLITEEGSFNEEKAPIVSNRTTCEDITTDNFKILPDTYDANVTFKYISSTTCRLKFYAVELIWLNYSRNITDYFKQETNKIMDLSAYTSYTISFQNKLTNISIRKPFTTKPTRPGEIKNVTYFSSSESITLIWNPSERNGEKLGYIVEYKLVGHKACDLNNSQEVQKKTEVQRETENEEIILQNLTSYSYYKIGILAKNEAGKGDTKIITVATSQSDDSSDELPVKKEIKNGDIYISPASCENIKGPLNYFINYTYQDNQTCINNPQPVLNSFDYRRVREKFSPPNVLIPDSNYLVTISTGRDNQKQHEKKHILHYKSNPSEPTAVKNLMAYSKNGSHVWLRWTAPCPTYGQLENYTIDVININGPNKIQISYDTTCLWQDENCAVIKDLRANNNYTFVVRAKNKDVAHYGKPFSISQVTIEAESQPPKNLNYKFEADQLILLWIHPDVTNGPLRQFEINGYVIQSELNNLAQNISEYYFIDMDQLNYNKKINATPATTFNISVVGINSKRGKSASIQVATPPPKPELLSSPILCCSEGTCSVKIPKVKICANCTLYVVVTIKENGIIHSAFQSNEFYKIPSINENSEMKIFHRTKLKDYSEQIITIETNVGQTNIYNDSNYLTSVILTSSYEGQHATNIYQLEYEIEASKVNVLYYLLLLLVIPLTALSYFAYRFWKKNGKSNKENGPKDSPSLLKNKSIRPEGPISEDSLPLVVLPTIAPKPHISKGIKQKYSNATDTNYPKSHLKDMAKEDTNDNQLGKCKKENTLRRIPPIEPKPNISKETKLKYSKVIELNNLKSYLQETAQGGTNHSELSKQHEMCRSGYNKSIEIGSMEINRKKNRYKDLIAYDHTRVKLKCPDENGSDYINANYIDGYKTKKAYIATQGPKITTVNDFWYMAWEQNVGNIVMLANVIENGKKKCEEYWPPLNQTRSFRDISVQNIKTNVFSSYIYRELEVTYKGSKRIINHLHFTLWPDHGVPLYPQNLVPFMKEMLKIPQGKRPVVVHCSAGIGRTGTILLCDIVLRMAALEQKVDFLKIYHKLREQRPKMVDNPAQYILAHLVVYECLFGKDFSISLDVNFKNNVEDLLTEFKIKSVIDYLEEVSWQIKVMQECFYNEILEVNKRKNRFPTILPGCSQIYLERYPGDDESSDYINAVSMDCFQNQDRFIVTQQPLPNTVGDFWRLILEFDVNTIISLNEIQQNDHTSCIFWPKPNKSFHPVDYIKVACVNEEDRGDFSSITIAVTDENKQEKKVINLICLNGWMPDNEVPPDLSGILAVREHMFNTTFGQENPIVVTCYDGAKASGLFVALSFLIEKIKLEHSCDIVLAVNTVRQRRMQCFRNKEQFKFLLKAALQYFESFDTYSNFDNI